MLEDDEIPRDWYSTLIGIIAGAIISAIVAFGFWAIGIPLPKFF